MYETSNREQISMTAAQFQQNSAPPNSPHIRPLDLAPAPTRHRLLFHLMRLRLRGDDGDARAPFDIGCERGAKFRVRRRTDFIGGVDQQIHPASPLRLVEMTP